MKMVRLGGFEPPTSSLSTRRLCRLDYKRMKWTVRRESNPPCQFGRLLPGPLGHARMRMEMNAVGRSRTCDRRLTKALLCRLSYDSRWSSRRESNPHRPVTISMAYKTKPIREVAHDGASGKKLPAGDPGDPMPIREDLGLEASGRGAPLRQMKLVMARRTDRQGRGIALESGDGLVLRLCGCERA